MMNPRENHTEPPFPDSQANIPLLIRLELELLRMRRRLIGDDQGDPVWAMVLELCAAQLEGRTLSVTSLCLASGLPVTTALRRLDELERDGHIKRTPDKDDRRRVFVVLQTGFYERTLSQIEAMDRVRAEILASQPG